MKKETTQEAQIADFVQRVQLTSWAREQEPNKGLFNLGIIVTKKNDDARDVARKVSELMKAEMISLPKDQYLFEDALVKANELGRSLAIVLEDDLPHDALELLKKISEFNSFSRLLAEKSVAQHSDTRIALVTGIVVWQKQSYPAFIDLFGVVCRLDIDTTI